MEIFMVMLLVIIIGIVIIYYVKNTKENTDKEIGIMVNSADNSFPTIKIIENEMIIPEEKNKIIDTNIKSAIANIDNSIINSTVITKNIKTSKELLNNRTFFSTTKKGTENMMKVKGTNEVYGTQIIGNKFSKNTKFVNENKMINNVKKNALMNAGFAAASMVVAQYYMNEINNKLEDMKEEINQISDFLDSKYQGELLHIISKMKEVIENKVEILDNDFLRSKKYDDIINIETTCSKLLGQANEMIKRNIKETNIDYKKFEKHLKEIHKWFSRQQLLQMLLLEIGNLRYVFSYGNESSKLSHTQYNNYLEQSNSINEDLKEWHTLISNKIGIDTKKSRINGKLFEFRKNTIGKINEEWAYDKLNNEILEIIENQTNTTKLKPFINNKQDEVIKIQKYNGEYYNLLKEEK